jgi:hypothetical protein
MCTERVFLLLWLVMSVVLLLMFPAGLCWCCFQTGVESSLPCMLAVNAAVPNRHALGVKAPLCDIEPT